MEAKKVSLFEFHGVALHKNGEKGQLKGDCPFCGSAGHFYAHPEKLLWDCKSCGMKGNAYGFIEALHEAARERTKVEDYKLLADERPGIPWQWLKEMGLAKDGTRWLLPSYSTNKKMVNLGIWTGGKTKVLGSPGCALHPVLAESLPGSQGSIYICEGHWDTYALANVWQKLRKPGVVIGVPGANTFKADWVKEFKDRDVYLLYDCDEAGFQGLEKAGELLAGVASSISILVWPDGTPERYDVRDVLEREKTPAKGWKALESLLQKMEDVKEEDSDIPRRDKAPFSFKTALTRFKKYLYMDKGIEESLSLMFATVLASRLPGDPLWIFLVAPPGAGKTLFLQCLETVPDCFFLSSLGAHSLISGYIPPGGGDPSLLPQLEGKCLILKDYTEVHALPDTAKEEVYAILRGAYDGRVRRSFGNRVELADYKCHFNMIAAVTPIIHSDNRATLGERFLKTEMKCTDYDKDQHIRLAIQGMKLTEEHIEELRQVCIDFLHVNTDLENLPTISLQQSENIIALSQVVAYLRAGVERSVYTKDLKYRPEPEIGTRLAKQLVKLSQALALVYDLKAVDARCYRLVEKTALSTAFGWGLDAITVLVRNFPGYITAEYISESMSASLSTVTRRLHDLLELGVITRTKIETEEKVAGRPQIGWSVTPEFQKLWKRAELDPKNLPKVAAKKRKLKPKKKV